MSDHRWLGSRPWFAYARYCSIGLQAVMCLCSVLPYWAPCHDVLMLGTAVLGFKPWCAYAWYCRTGLMAMLGTASLGWWQCSALPHWADGNARYCHTGLKAMLGTATLGWRQCSVLPHSAEGNARYCHTGLKASIKWPLATLNCNDTSQIFNMTVP